MLNCKDVDKTVKALLDAQCYQATKYLSPTQVVRVTKPRQRGCKGWDRRANRHTLSLTIGAPNYAERAFIKKCRTAGEPFPVKKIQLRDFPNAGK